ncbi:MAG: hypothetical protein IJJ33_15750, partial [Victivallales bacterium]|nr:hypothetical protein [Victivallales bacterium]
MSENQNQNPVKLTLKTTDTNRFKVDQAAGSPTPAALNPQTTGGDAEPRPISDPISLRDTATGRLRKLEVNQLGGAAVAPAAEGGKTETVHLKVVRNPPASAAQSNSPTLKLNIPRPSMPAAA